MSDGTEVRTARWPGQRVDRLRASRSYGFVLVLVLAAIVLLAVGGSSRGAWSAFAVLQASILLVALWTSGLGELARRTAIVVALATIATIALQFVLASQGRGVTGIVNALLVVVTCVVIGLGVLDQREINTQSVLGVVTIYLLLGVLFTFVFSAVAVLDDGPFFAQGTDGSMADRVYFSFVTLATLGYGDFTAASTVGRMLAVNEAILGQLYLVTVVAVVVSRLGPRRTQGDAG